MAWTAMVWTAIHSLEYSNAGQAIVARHTYIHTYIHAYIHTYIDSYEYSNSGEAIVAGVVALKFFQQNACEDDDWRSRGTVERVSETQVQITWHCGTGL